MKKIIIFLIFSCQIICCFGSAIAADNSANQDTSQFNFDDNYQGDEAPKGKNDLAVYDPFETINRKVFIFNEAVDKNLVLPVVRQYRKSVPKPIRTSASNFINNLSAPFSTINSVIQGNGDNAMASFSSFLINSTLGVAGLFDVAGQKKIKYSQEDFGQTFGKYGSNAGAYLVLPLLGPSNVRDFSGSVIERLVDPLSFNGLEIGGSSDFISEQISVSLFVTNAITTRESLIEVVDDIRKNSFDPYATIRSGYLQRRQSLILNQ